MDFVLNYKFLLHFLNYSESEKLYIINIGYTMNGPCGWIFKELRYFKKLSTLNKVCECKITIKLNTTSWTQDLKWMCARRSEHVFMLFQFIFFVYGVRRVLSKGILFLLRGRNPWEISMKGLILLVSVLYGLPSRHLHVQSQQWVCQKNMWNLFKVNNKDTRMTSFDFTYYFGVSNLNMNKQIPAGLLNILTTGSESFTIEKFLKEHQLVGASAIFLTSLTHSFPMHPFSTPWKHQKSLRFSLKKKVHWERMS